ncbi:MAG: 3-oxoacyl-ACP reductase FabG [Chloroflexi bacterium]|nr:MAG: 3-oxoacyl-ACP reductase FabG [Chloroflexota bacterium]TMD54714.1 MAG: 3-oxoacyl-ACP reductase FabG [Chloroflexota bacterium]
MELNLAGKAVVVTGGANNIGRGIALAFAAEKARVLIADIDEERAERVASEAGGAEVAVQRTDVSSWESTQSMAARAVELFGRIDVLVNCAGGTIDRLFLEKPREEWEREVAINFWGFINCSRAVLDPMVEQRSGAVVSLSSDAGRMGEWRETVYSGTKAGIIAMSKSLAREMGSKGIRFNVVCPGFTPGKRDAGGDFGEGSMWSGKQGEQFPEELLEKIAKSYPLRRLGTPEDIAPAVLFLASEAASYITGQTLSVSGGYTMM